MPRVAPGDRKRQYRPKTRRVRRVKCGEERPNCLRCTSTGRPCDGYDVPTFPSASKLTSSRQNALAKPLVPRPLSDPSYCLFTSDEERRSFQFFLAKTAPQLAGDFECAFWGRLLLQSAHHEPAIRHVTVALGSLHESFERNAGAPFRYGANTTSSSFALHQYLRAIRCLRPMPESSQPIDVCIISCVLFACFEAMSGQYGSAITHVTSGLKILDELRTNPNNGFVSPNVGRTPYIPLDVLCGLFTRLQGQVIVTVHRISAARCNLWPDLVMDLNRPIVFHSLADARETLEVYTYYYRQQSTELQIQSTQTMSLEPRNSINPVITVHTAAVALRDTSLSLLDRWSAALDDFLRGSGTSLTDRERRATAVLQLRKIDCFISLDALSPIGEADTGDHLQWDRHCAFFEQMVTLGESIVDLNSSSISPSSPLALSPPKSFSLDLGIVAGMFNVAIRCRDPHIRRRAVRVLRAAAAQEGVWNSVVAAAIAEKWIEIEEEGLGVVASCADVPAVARLADFVPVFDIEQPGATVYFSRSSRMGQGIVRREVFTW
ncbi:Zn(II)2Cys6 transcription factor domain-containing protein [Aspergillus homomorphus CBS 101889]|uniref:Zn(2)-C6 fungal-type domain-containing protein n=1 Tax=Aspergillus homomorphus (strain CBS 101889) TaxID=1450537 RepID=A0A395I6K7_ASPHC|nr:hypothetical protein BO97DRAFT_423272 [Aspergillus homomorphus CBS 101889]RAL13894.1 hypothetical protein BO97DRAFT_423272 [Aspergillus homomorphus CBS 101889]